MTMPCVPTHTKVDMVAGVGFLPFKLISFVTIKFTDFRSSIFLLVFYLENYLDEA